MRILLVDDDPETRLAARYGLERAGHEVWETEDGAGAARVASAPDVILMDLLLGAEDGAEVASSLLARPGWGGVPVVYLTARDDAATVRRLHGTGAAGVLTKPFDPLSLAEALAALLAH